MQLSKSNILLQHKNFGGFWTPWKKLKFASASVKTILSQ